MRQDKTAVFLKSLWRIVLGVWKLILLTLYGISKLTEGFAAMVAKITEKFIK